MYFACGTKRDKPSGHSPKKRTKRWIAAVLAAVLLLSLLCGCGGQSEAEAVVERFFNALINHDTRTMASCILLAKLANYVPELRDEDLEREMDDLIDLLNPIHEFEILDAEKVNQDARYYISDMFHRGADEIRSIGEIGDIYLVPVFIGSGVLGVFVMQIGDDYFICDM